MTDAHRVCVIPGDGVGTEVIPQALRVLRAAAAACGFGLEFDQRPWGSAYYLEHGRMMPADAATVVAGADATLFGAVGSPEVPDSVSAWGLILSLRSSWSCTSTCARCAVFRARTDRARVASPC
jgi:tartrate dehydrogenase/decarboxylase / D-malate dehydrogenase